MIATAALRSCGLPILVVGASAAGGLSGTNVNGMVDSVRRSGPAYLFCRGRRGRGSVTKMTPDDEDDPHGGEGFHGSLALKAFKCSTRSANTAGE